MAVSTPSHFFPSFYLGHCLNRSCHCQNTFVCTGYNVWDGDTGCGDFTNVANVLATTTDNNTCIFSADKGSKRDADFIAGSRDKLVIRTQHVVCRCSCDDTGGSGQCWCWCLCWRRCGCVVVIVRIGCCYCCWCWYRWWLIIQQDLKFLIVAILWSFFPFLSSRAWCCFVFVVVIIIGCSHKMRCLGFRIRYSLSLWMTIILAVAFVIRIPILVLTTWALWSISGWTVHIYFGRHLLLAISVD